MVSRAEVASVASARATAAPVAAREEVAVKVDVEAAELPSADGDDSETHLGGSLMDSFKNFEAKRAAAPEEMAPAAIPAVEPVEVAPTPRSAGNLEGPALWEAARAALIEVRPLFETWLSAAAFVSHGDGRFVIGFSPAQRFFRESLSRYEKDIEEQISALAPAPVRLVIEISDEVEAVALVEIEDEEPEPSVEGVVVPVIEYPELSGPELLTAPVEDFKNDPLIKEALQTFEARVIKS